MIASRRLVISAFCERFWTVFSVFWLNFVVFVASSEVFVHFRLLPVAFGHFLDRFYIAKTRNDQKVSRDNEPPTGVESTDQEFSQTMFSNKSSKTDFLKKSKTNTRSNSTCIQKRVWFEGHLVVWLSTWGVECWAPGFRPSPQPCRTGLSISVRIWKLEFRIWTN